MYLCYFISVHLVILLVLHHYYSALIYRQADPPNYGTQIEVADMRDLV